MPRNRRDNEVEDLKPQDVEEDFLDVDKPLPGQNYYCISFVSPEKVLAQKELFIFHHYERAFYKKITNLMETSLTNLIEKSDDGKIDVSDVIKIKKSVLEACKEEENTFDQFKDKFEDFRFRDEDKIGEAFDKANNFRTSVRGVKVRGVFDSKREADVRASVLQRMDPLFDVFVGQVGYWCPWDPNPHKIDDIEYLNNDLNKLVKEYKVNEAKKDQFYQEQKTQRQKDALSSEERLKHQKGLAEMRAYQEQVKSSQANASNPASIGNVAGSSESLISSGGLINDINNLVVIDESVENQEEQETKENVISQSLSVNDPNAKEISVEQQTEQLQSEDPWLQRKLAQQSESS